jgi:hypothetical protein
VLVTAVDFVDLHDKLIEIRNSKYVAIFAVDDTPGFDSPTVVRSP